MIDKEMDLKHLNLALNQSWVKSDQLKWVVFSHERVLLVLPCYTEVKVDVAFDVNLVCWCRIGALGFHYLFLHEQPFIYIHIYIFLGSSSCCRIKLGSGVECGGSSNKLWPKGSRQHTFLFCWGQRTQGAIRNLGFVDLPGMRCGVMGSKSAGFQRSAIGVTNLRQHVLQ